MRRLLLGLVIMGIVGTLQGVTISPSNENIQYMGRWNHDNPEQPWVGWKGATVLVRFSGTAISVDLDSGSMEEQYRVIIDGVPDADRLYVQPGVNTYVLASGLASGTHTVVLMKETFYGDNNTLHGFDITGTIMAPPPKPTMRIEFFGDSNMDGTSLYSEQDGGDHGSYYAFPAVLSRMLGAELNDQSVGGARLDGPGDNTIRSFIFSEDYYNQGYTPTFNPHVIVINAGANDVTGNARKSVVVTRFKDVIADLRSVYGPSPHIILFNAYGWHPEEPAIYTQEVVDEVGGNLSACVYPWMWEQYHGSMIEHAGEARILAEHILSLGLGFTQVQDAEIFDSFGRDFNVANGSFEGVGKANFGAFGWRYFDDNGVERVHGDAYDGSYFLRLTANSGAVHQGTDATGDFLPGPTSGNQQYTITLWMRGTPGAQAEISADYQVQQVYERTADPADVKTFSVTSSWEQYTATLSAPDGIWLTYIKLHAISGTVDFDAVSMTGGGSGSYCGDGTCDPGEDQCNCAGDCGPPPSSEANCSDGIDNDCDGDTDSADSDCAAVGCGDSVCDPGEDCNTCPADCISRSRPTALAYCCGDGTCENAENATNCAVDCTGGSFCGDGTCDPGEDQCDCSDDCGLPPATETLCSDGVDNDCDGATDGADSDCGGSCAAVGEYCASDDDCCSLNCFVRQNRCK
jgi:lysophospholipase L1-like esterase